MKDLTGKQVKAFSGMAGEHERSGTVTGIETIEILDMSHYTVEFDDGNTEPVPTIKHISERNGAGVYYY